MAKAGDIMTSPATGETFKFIKTAADTDGELLQIEMVIAAGGGAKSVPPHIHPKQEERFYIKTGEIKFLLDGKEFVAGPGETVIIPAGAVHTWWNATSQQATYLLEFAPAGQMEILFENLCAAAQAGALSPNGESNQFALAVTLHKYP